jgi:hypothetical protein
MLSQDLNSKRSLVIDQFIIPVYVMMAITVIFIFDASDWTLL